MLFALPAAAEHKFWLKTVGSVAAENSACQTYQLLSHTFRRNITVILSSKRPL